MLLEIISPEKIVFKEEVEEVTIPTENGEITILPHHVNLLTKVVLGELHIKMKGKTQTLAVTRGFLQVSNNTVTILADYAVRAEDIVAEKAIEAQKRAEEILKKKKEGVSERDFAIAEADLRRSLLELKVSKRRHRTTQQP